MASGEITTNDKLSMALDDLMHDDNHAESEGVGGKSKNTKRADRIAQSGPYPPRASRYGDDDAAERRVYVGNLSWTVKWQDLKEHMASVGPVEHAVVLESNGRSKGCGIVTYQNLGHAHLAIEQLNDSELDGRKIFVREDREAGASPQARTHYGCRVYVGNLSWNVKWQDLKDHMKQAGNVIHADVLEESGGRSKGCGLVEYSTPEEAQNAIASLNDTQLGGRMIFVREDREPDSGSISSIARRGVGRGGGRGGAASGRAPPRPMPMNTHNSSEMEGCQLYVGNLPWNVTWYQLKDLFRTVGDVDRTEIAEYPDGRSRGFGIVRFTNPADAQQAINSLNGHQLDGRAIEVRYDKRS